MPSGRPPCALVNPEYIQRPLNMPATRSEMTQTSEAQHATFCRMILHLRKSGTNQAVPLAGGLLAVSLKLTVLG
jgi:hypothetical protein